MGFNTKRASSAATMLQHIAIVNTALHPCALAMMAATGTINEPAPLAVYSMPALAAAYLEPKVSPWVAGNRLKISPYTPKYNAVTSTYTTGFGPVRLKVNSAPAPKRK